MKIYSNGFNYSLVSSKKNPLQFAFLKMTLNIVVLHNSMSLKHTLNVIYVFVKLLDNIFFKH